MKKKCVSGVPMTFPSSRSVPPETRIALWNTAFLGDAVLTLPLAQALHKRYPETPIDFYVRAGLEPLFEANPVFNAVYGVRKKSKSLSSIRAMGAAARQRRYSLWVAAHSSLRTGLVSYLSRAKRRIGYSETPLAGLWFTKTTSRRFKELDEIERLLELALAAGCEESSSEPVLVLSDEAHAEAVTFFETIYNDGVASVVGLHPGSVWETKRWPAEYFAEIGRKALEQGAAVVVFAGPGEEAIASLVVEALRKHEPEKTERLVYDVSGKLSLAQLGAFISKLSCYVTNDSGPMHLSWAQKVPTVAVFGPTVKSLGFFPRGRDSHVVEIPLKCRPCGLHGHKSCPLKHHDCMRKIAPELVWQRVKGYLTPQE